jgi:hypothetical protein
VPADYAGALGVEWWVQVKNIAKRGAAAETIEKAESGEGEEEEATEGDSSSDHRDQVTAIDLHYDKDERLAETFNLLRSPLVSTVAHTCTHFEHACLRTCACTRMETTHNERAHDTEQQCHLAKVTYLTEHRAESNFPTLVYR